MRYAEVSNTLGFDRRVSGKYAAVPVLAYLAAQDRTFVDGAEGYCETAGRAMKKGRNASIAEKLRAHRVRNPRPSSAAGGGVRVQGDMQFAIFITLWTRCLLDSRSLDNFRGGVPPARRWNAQCLMEGNDHLIRHLPSRHLQTGVSFRFGQNI
jgi:hypothetical protein